MQPRSIDVTKVGASMVSILMSTYNGEKFIEEQIDSIRRQNYRQLILIIRDDGSTDATIDIIRRASECDNRIIFINDESGNLGPAGSFSRLLREVKTEYFMFSDQDDVWLPDKVERTLSCFTDKNKPQVVFTDLVVVDERLEPLADSFMQMSRFDAYSGKELNREIIQNIVVGCTMAGNRRLLEFSGLAERPPPASMIMHDWWLALVAVCFGDLIFEDRPTILYRQHGNNCLGAKESGFFNYLKLLRKGKPWLKAQDFLRRVIAQAEAFLATYGDELSAEQHAIFSRVIDLRAGAITPGLIAAYLRGIQMHSFDRNVALWASFAFGRNATVFH